MPRQYKQIHFVLDQIYIYIIYHKHNHESETISQFQMSPASENGIYFENGIYSRSNVADPYELASNDIQGRSQEFTLGGSGGE